MTDKPADIIDIHSSRMEDGKLTFSRINDKWRCAYYERRHAEEDKRRIDKKLENKRKL